MACEALDLKDNFRDDQDGGMQYLCAKYSGLISQLRSEVLVRQNAEAEARLLERQLRDARRLLEAERARWEEERRVLREEILVLRTVQRENDELLNVENLEMRRTAATSERLNIRCDQLHQVCAHEAEKTMQALGQAAAGSDQLLQRQREVAVLREDRQDLLARLRQTQEELDACKEHLSRWRRAAADLETRADSAVRVRVEAEARARHSQEEMRGALRAASTARAREAATAHSADRGVKELRTREARMHVLRNEGHRQAKRATSAEKRLKHAERIEVTAAALQHENKELKIRLEAEVKMFAVARDDLAKVESLARAESQQRGELQTELRARDSLAVANRQRLVDLEGELSRARAKLEHVESHRAAAGAQAEGLRGELKALGGERDRVREEREHLAAELKERERRVTRGTPQLAEYKRRLSNAEDAMARAQAEASEERRARERCHLEAVRAAEKLRLARAHSSQLKHRVRTLEESDLRYPSRLRQPSETGLRHDDFADVDVSGGVSAQDLPEPPQANLSSYLQPEPCSVSPGAAPRWPPPRACDAPRWPSSAGRAASEPRSRPGSAGGAPPLQPHELPGSIRDFIAQEDRRLQSALGPQPGQGPGASPVSMAWEEPRSVTPVPAVSCGAIPASTRSCPVVPPMPEAALSCESFCGGRYAALDRSLPATPPLASTSPRPTSARSHGGTGGTGASTASLSRDPLTREPLGREHLVSDPLAGDAFAMDPELAALLAAEPRVLQLPTRTPTEEAQALLAEALAGRRGLAAEPVGRGPTEDTPTFA